MAPSSHCQIRRATDPLNTCDDAITNFAPEKWLGTDPAGHLVDGLTYVLQAAQEWQCQRDLSLRLGGYQTQVYAMDSVSLRARSLFEFFLGRGRSNYCHARCLFGLPDQLRYPRYTSGPSGPNSSWKHLLHYGSIHIQDRANPVQLEGYDGQPKDLNEMPVDIAKGILDVWEIFEDELVTAGEAQLHTMAKTSKENAKQAARHVYDSVGQRAGSYANKAEANMTNLF